MNESDFRQELKNGICGAYLFFGDEEYLKDFYSGRAEKQTVGNDSDMAAFNTYIIEGRKIKNADTSQASLEEALKAVPLMGEKVFIKYTANFTLYSESETEEFLRTVSTIDEATATLIAVAVKDGFDTGNFQRGKPSAMYKKYTAVLKPVCLNKMTESELRRWIDRRLGREELRILPEASEMLLKQSGTSMMSLSGELDKLTAYAKANSMNEISADTVKLVASVNEEEEMFAMANAILNGDRAKALSTLHRCKTAREEPYAVLGMIGKALCEMYTVRCLMADGKDKKEISAKLKMHEFRAGKIIDAVKNSEPRRLYAAVKRCSEADLALKSMPLGYIALERFICTLPTKK